MRPSLRQKQSSDGATASFGLNCHRSSQYSAARSKKEMPNCRQVRARFLPCWRMDSTITAKCEMTQIDGIHPTRNTFPTNYVLRVLDSMLKPDNLHPHHGGNKRRESTSKSARLPPRQRPLPPSVPPSLPCLSPAAPHNMSAVSEFSPFSLIRPNDGDDARKTREEEQNRSSGECERGMPTIHLGAERTNELSAARA